MPNPIWQKIIIIIIIETTIKKVLYRSGNLQFKFEMTKLHLIQYSVVFMV